METDQAENSIRTRTFSDASFTFNEGAFFGKFSEKKISGSTNLTTEYSFNAAVPSGNHTDGTLEINHKYDKIEKDRFSIHFDLSPGIHAQVSSVQPETTALTADSYSGFLHRIYKRIAQELLKLPYEDIAFFQQGIPDESWNKVLR